MPVRPYRPNCFGKLDPFGVSILVLGESSYLPNGSATLPDHHNEGIIAAVARREKDNTITKAVGLFYGRWCFWAERSAFWERVAFANFVQANMGGSRNRPSDADWRSGVEPFWRCLNELQPDFVLVLGLELWSFLPQESEGRSGDPLEEPVEDLILTLDGERRTCRSYPRSNGFSLAFAVPHPAWPNLSYRKWTPWVLAAMQKQRELAAVRDHRHVLHQIDRIFPFIENHMRRSQMDQQEREGHLNEVRSLFQLALTRLSDSSPRLTGPEILHFRNRLEGLQRKWAPLL